MKRIGIAAFAAAMVATAGSAETVTLAFTSLPSAQGRTYITAGPSAG